MNRKLLVQRNILILLLLTCLTFHIIFGLESKRQINALEGELFLLNLENRSLNIRKEMLFVDNDILMRRLSEWKEEKAQIKKQYMGEFEITYYTAGPESTGKSPGHPAYGITRSGAVVEEGRTIAADWSVLEPGTRVYIDGIGERIVEDTGGLIVDKAIDVYVEDVEVALQGGRHKADVWIVVEE